MSTTKRGRPAASEKTSSKAAKKAEISEMETSSTGDTSDQGQELFKLLITTKVQTLRPPEGRIFIAQRDDKVIDVWKGLIRHNFLSVPVLQKTKQKYYGSLDLVDIVNFIVEHFGDVVLKKTEDFWKLVDEEEFFRNTKVRDIMKYPLNRRNPFQALPVDYSLMTAAEFLARERGLHRIAIVDDSRKLMGWVSQSRIVSFLHENMDKLGDKRNKTLGSNQKLFHEVFSIDSQAQTIDGFKMLLSKNVMGIGVVAHDSGKLIGNLSVKDLKGISSEGGLFWRLYEPVSVFLDKLKNEFKLIPQNVITAKAEDNIEHVINLMTEHKIHRVYIVDNEEKPIGIVTIKDLLLEMITV